LLNSGVPLAASKHRLFATIGPWAVGVIDPLSLGASANCVAEAEEQAPTWS